MATAHRLGRRRTLEVGDLADETLLLLRPDFISRGWFDAACEVAHVKPRVLLESGAPHTLIALARAGHGMTIVPSSVRLARAGVRVAPILHAGRSLGAGCPSPGIRVGSCRPMPSASSRAWRPTPDAATRDSNSVTRHPSPRHGTTDPMGHEVSFGRHRFDPPTGRLWSGKREVRLTPKAAAVLAALVARAGQPVTREELFASVWGDTVVSDAALASCIQELREALGDDAKQPRFIETRHRRGYRFVAPLSRPATEQPARVTLGRLPSSSGASGSWGSCAPASTGPYRGSGRSSSSPASPGSGRRRSSSRSWRTRRRASPGFASGRAGASTTTAPAKPTAGPRGADPALPGAGRRRPRPAAPPARTELAGPDALAPPRHRCEDAPAPDLRRDPGADAARARRRRRGRDRGAAARPVARGPPLERRVDPGLAGLRGAATRVGAAPPARRVPVGRGPGPRAPARER